MTSEAALPMLYDGLLRLAASLLYIGWLAND